jgi:hypothetical protein
MQTRMGSFVEAVANVAAGFMVSVLANLVVLPAFGYAVTMGDALGIGLVFTGISLARSFLIRRYFNAMRHFRTGGTC